MPKESKIITSLREALKSGAPVITAADINAAGIMQKVQRYFEAGGEAVMDVIDKDDLVQNFPDEGLFALSFTNSGTTLKMVTMFEGEEDMYFRTDGTTEAADEFGQLPTVSFLETVETLSTMKL